MSIIELRGITKSYGNKKVLDNFSINIEKGDFIGITGNSGSGKSTLLNIIGLLECFDSGDLIINGYKNIKVNSNTAMKVLRYELSYLFQNYALVDNETVLANLYLAMKYIKKSKKEKLIMIKEALHSVGLDGYNDQHIYQLSGGEQQRVAIARLLLKPCKIILADEPTGSLDENNRNEILELLISLNKQGKTIILVTHDDFVASRCQKLIRI
ncbi:MAG: putative bacteriocin export ABC transporter [Clostridium sp.]